MEPFELKLHQVTFDESDGNLGQGEGQIQTPLDSLSALVHYDANFRDKTESGGVQEGSSLHELTFSTKGKEAQTYSDHTSANTSTTYTAAQSPKAGQQTSSSPQSPHSWESPYLGETGLQENFLVNPDDYFLPSPSQFSKVSPESAAASLRTLSQVSVNTAAVARHLRKAQGGKRRVAKTTLTTTVLSTPRTMSLETSQTSAPSAAVLGAEEMEASEVGDSSFETVAEALRLQWSVIGNSNITPASPEEVARIVAEAEKRLKGGFGTESSTYLPTFSVPSGPAQTPTISASGSQIQSPIKPLPGDPKIPENISLGSVSSFSSFSSSTANENSSVPLSTEGFSSELVRISAESITREVGRSSWFQSRDKQSTTPVSDASKKVTSGEGSFRDGAFVKTSQIDVDNSLHSETKSAREINANLTVEAYGQSASLQENSPQMKREPVPFGTGVTSPADLSFKSPLGSTPYSSPFSQPNSLSGAGMQMAISQQRMASVQHQESLQQPEVSDSLSFQPHTSSNHSSSDAAEDSFSTSMPAIPGNVAPLPQIGPLFPRKIANFSSDKVHYSNVSPSALHKGKHWDGYEELLREKLKLEGQLEVLQDEAQSTLQERAELQAQLASLQLKLKTLQQKGDDPEKANLRAELQRLRETRLDHEREALEVQTMLEEKLEELKAVTEDLYQSQDTADKLQVRMKELRDDLQVREVTVQALKNKIAELYVEVQTTLQSKMEADGEARRARNDLESLVKAKEWYQEQLSIAHEVRAKLQRQLTQLQAQTVSQGSIMERMKLESNRLRLQLRESQERALREKEQLARHLETIQQDMMDREAAFQEIQRERLMIEDTFNTQVTTVEEEKTRISNLLHLITELESQLEQAHHNSKKKQEHIFTLENEQMELMKKMTLTQEVLVEKEQLLEEADQKLIEVESQLDAFTRTLAAKDDELLQLREDKATTEIALKAALQEKESVDRALDTLKGDMGKVEKSFKQMRQELGSRLAELETAQSYQKAARDELDRVAHELDIKNRSLETLTHSHQEQTTLMEQFQAEKAALNQYVLLLKQELQQAQLAESTGNTSHQVALQTELQETRARLMEAESRLKVSTVQLEQAASLQQAERASGSVDQLEALAAERNHLLQQLRQADQEKIMQNAEQQKQKEKLDEEMAGLKAQLSESRSEFERNVHIYVEQITSVMEEKQRLETELEMMRRKFELSSLQQQEQIGAELQTIMMELESAQLQKQGLERQLQALQMEKDAQITGLQQQLAETQRALQVALQEQNQQVDKEALNQQLLLELEKERGRIAGFQQSNRTLKEHLKQLEEALAGRESSLGQLTSHLENSNRERESEQHEYLKRIQELEMSLKKEKDGGRDLRKQIGGKITENKRLLKLQEVHKKEEVQLHEEVERYHTDTVHLQADLDAARQSVRDHQAELQMLQGEKHALEIELERVKRELADNTDRNPVLLEQIQSLEWQLSQRNQEVQVVQKQLALAEQRQASEMDSLRRALQEKQEELENLQGELNSVKQEKADQKSRVFQLRSVLKASVQHHKLTKKLNNRQKAKESGGGDGSEEKATQANMDNGIIIPPLPFDMDAVEQLLLDTAVKPLDSKPLDNLSTCLSSLRAEISGLQKQMEVHTNNIYSSTESWRSVEAEVKDLQEVVKSIANTIMESSATNTTTITSAGDVEFVDDGAIVHI